MDIHYETSIFAELECSGYWRLQSDEPSLTAKLRHRASEKSSPWSITGTPLNAESFELVSLIDHKGWSVKRPSVARNRGKVDARLTENEQCNGEEKEVA